MLRRNLAGSASFVCPRCRLQLARSVLQRQPFPAIKSAFAVSPPRSPRRRIGTHAAPTASDEPDNQDDGETQAEPTGEMEEEHSEGLGIYRLSAPPRNRKYKSRGHIVLPEQESLSVGILGKPASAIVLREKDALRRRNQLKSDESQDNAQAEVDVASLLPGGSTAAPPEDFLLNIHELRPMSTRDLTIHQFTELKNTLVEGFKSEQLASYIKEFQQVRRLGLEEGGASETAPWLLELQPWVLVAQDATKDVKSQLDGAKAKTPKERLAVRLMRECWKLSYQVLDRDGYLRVRLRDVDFSLLTLGSRRWLESLPRPLLRQVKEVKFIRESHLVSILAPKPVAESILEKINLVLSYARTTDFPAGLVSLKPLRPDVLKEVGRMTNTATRLDQSGKNVIITWINFDVRNENFETPAEIVFRFLRDAYGPKPRASSALEIVPGRRVARRGRYLTELDCGQRLPWQERLDKWERWTAAISQSTSSSNPQMPYMPTKMLPFPVGSGETVSEAESSANTPPGWSPDLHTDTSAVFGHVVFTRQGQPSPVPSSGPKTILDPSLPRTFVPLLPSLNTLDFPSNLYEEGLWHTTILIRFSPSPDMPPELINSAPDLELRLEADHQEIQRLRSLRAVTDTFTGDVLCPAAAADVRLVQRRYFALPGPSIEHHARPLITFLSKSDLRPRHGKLNTPPCLFGMPLPRRFLSPSPLGDANTTNTAAAAREEDANDDDAAAAEVVEDVGGKVAVDYNLASIEVRRTVTAAYEGLKLRYTSIQAGQRGGERAELSLEAVQVDVDKEPPNPKESDVYDFAKDTESRRSFVTHVLNDPDKAVKPAVPTKPADIKKFFRVASRIVSEQGRLKWHSEV